MDFNNLLAVMQAVQNSVSTGENQQLADTQMATQDAQIEQGEYNTYNEQITAAEQAVNGWASKIATDPTNKGYQAQLAASQAAFQNLQTNEQTNTQQADSATQSAQTQAGQDSSSLQQKVQLEAAINQICQALTSALNG